MGKIQGCTVIARDIVGPNTERERSEMSWLLEADEVVKAAGVLNVPPRQLLEVARVLNPAQLRHVVEMLEAEVSHSGQLISIPTASILWQQLRREAGLE